MRFAASNQECTHRLRERRQGPKWLNQACRSDIDMGKKDFATLLFPLLEILPAVLQPQEVSNLG
jgi:hypothetical protein